VAGDVEGLADAGILVGIGFTEARDSVAALRATVGGEGRRRGQAIVGLGVRGCRDGQGPPVDHAAGVAGRVDGVVVAAVAVVDGVAGDVEGLAGAGILVGIDFTEARYSVAALHATVGGEGCRRDRAIV